MANNDHLCHLQTNLVSSGMSLKHGKPKSSGQPIFERRKLFPYFRDGLGTPFSSTTSTPDP